MHELDYNNNMKIVAISDNHGILTKKLREDIGTCDVLLIAGDTADLYKQKSMDGSKWWYKENFLPWLNHVDAKHIVMVAGNHDFWLEKEPDEFRKMIEGTNITYLENEYVTIDGVTIYGTPLCHKFYNWAFMPDDDKQREIYEKTMDDRKIDILLSHDAPYGCSDVCFKASWPVEDPHIGSHVLRDVILEKKPMYCLHGHLHSTNHEEEILGDTKVYNVSVVCEDYAIHYEPLVIEYEPKQEDNEDTINS